MKSKNICLRSAEEAEQYIELLKKSSSIAIADLVKEADYRNGLEVLEKIKFEQIGRDPLNPDRALNLIEQVNQTFTYYASFLAVEFLFERHKDIEYLNLNLGTAPGYDIESDPNSSVVAEIFAATSPSSNQKLKKDIMKMANCENSFRYVIFWCPNVPMGLYSQSYNEGVIAWSLGGIET